MESRDISLVLQGIVTTTDTDAAQKVLAEVALMIAGDGRTDDYAELCRLMRKLGDDNPEVGWLIEFTDSLEETVEVMADPDALAAIEDADMELGSTHDYDTRKVLAVELDATMTLVGESGGLSSVYGTGPGKVLGCVPVTTEHGVLFLDPDDRVTVLDDATDPDAIYVIYTRTDETRTDGGEILWWNNDTGWGDQRSVTRFTEDETRVFNLPEGGRWCELAIGAELLVTCRHCHRVIVNENGRWIDPEATGDDSVWRETCDAHDTFVAEHEPDDESLSCDWHDDYPADHKDHHTHDEGKCCECGGHHCCGSSLCPVNTPPEGTN